MLDDLLLLSLRFVHTISGPVVPFVLPQLTPLCLLQLPVGVSVNTTSESLRGTGARYV